MINNKEGRKIKANSMVCERIKIINKKRLEDHICLNDLGDIIEMTPDLPVC